jgi:serine/threonine-protein kinase
VAKSDSTRAPRASWKRRARDLLGAPLDAALRAPFARECAETNRRRLAVLLPLMAVAHLAHVAVFATLGAERVSLAPRVLQWRDAVALTHFVTFAFAAALAVVARSRSPAAAARIGPLAALTYLLHGAIIVGVDQLRVTSVTPFVGYALGTCVVVAMTPRVTLTLYAIALAAFVAAMLAMQPSPELRLAILPNGVSAVVVSVALSFLLDGGRRRDFAQRAIIDEQRATLAHLNMSLERRLAEKVAEVLRRAAEIESLNTQLQAQVRERSAELSMALAKLARRRDTGGVLRPGFLLGDRFEIEGPIGEGGMGMVYAGLDRSTRERVAIKVIQASSSRELDALHRFLREAASAAAVNHAAVVRVLHVDVSGDGMLFQVQELVDGDTLQARLRGRPWDPAVVARLVSVLCAALAAAHERGVVHRDVKPSNVMLTAGAPGLKLLDFGIAKLYEDAALDEASTRTGTILGTPAFMAPEQVDGSTQLGDRADVYAVGVILFLLLAGRYPFAAPSPRRMLLSHVAETPPDLRSILPSIPGVLADLVARCLAKEPAARPRAEELAGLLAQFAHAAGTASLDELERAGGVHDIDASQALPITVPVRKRATAAQS